MPVTIKYGNPNRWRRWVSPDVPKTGAPLDRPSPGTWFFEARYHHTGHWKVGLDYRPQDGKMPDLWMPPFMWRPAWEIELVEKQLGTGWSGAADMLGIPIHGPEAGEAFWQQVKEYGEKAKNKKKLLFGSADNLGMHEHKITTPLTPAQKGMLELGSDKTSLMATPPPQKHEAIVTKTFAGMPVIVDPALKPNDWKIVDGSIAVGEDALEKLYKTVMDHMSQGIALK